MSFYRGMVCENITINGSAFSSTGNSTINNLTTGSASTVFVSEGAKISGDFDRWGRARAAQAF